jgi:hypothetical protein
MLLKISTQDGWEIVPDIGRAKYGGPVSRKWGFYLNKADEEHPFEVVVYRLDLDGEYFYCPYNSDALMIKASEIYGDPVNVKIHGRSDVEVGFLGADKDEIHDEDVIFMSWLYDMKADNIYLFDVAYLLNDKGDTIEKIGG